MKNIKILFTAIILLTSVAAQATQHLCKVKLYRQTSEDLKKVPANPGISEYSFVGESYSGSFEACEAGIKSCETSYSASSPSCKNPNKCYCQIVSSSSNPGNAPITDFRCEYTFYIRSTNTNADSIIKTSQGLSSVNIQTACAKALQSCEAQRFSAVHNKAENTNVTQCYPGKKSSDTYDSNPTQPEKDQCYFGIYSKVTKILVKEVLGVGDFACAEANPIVMKE